MSKAIYLTGPKDPDRAIMRGLSASGCELVLARSIVEVIQHLGKPPYFTDGTVLVAELEAGATALLTLLHEQDGSRSAMTSHSPATQYPVMVYDPTGGSVASAVCLVQLGVRDYVLGTSSESERELAARLLVERYRCKLMEQTVRAEWRTPVPEVAGATRGGQFQWNARDNVIRCNDGDIYVSQTEGRIFDILVHRRGAVVSIDDIIHQALRKNNASEDPELAAERVRAHMMRLRHKLQDRAALANRIINIRGAGYMLV
jgi:DNA-binding response OmpR family regulator